MTEAVREIKRYPNRKLYDTRDSRYVTLQQIAEYVRNGEDVRIVDNTTKEDLTHVTLAQIIYEEERKGEQGKGLNIAALRSFIQQGGVRIMTTLREGPVGKLIHRHADEEITADDSAPHQDESGARISIFKPKEALDELQRIADDRVRSLLLGAVSRVQQLQTEVRRLQGRIDELEARLRTMSERPKKPDPSDNSTQS